MSKSERNIVNVSMNADAKQALESIANERSTPERTVYTSDIVREAIRDYFISHGIDVPVEVDRGGYRETYRAAVENDEGEIVEIPGRWKDGKLLFTMTPEVLHGRGQIFSMDRQIEKYKRDGYDVLVIPRKHGSATVLITAVPQDNHVSHDEWARVAAEWSKGNRHANTGE